MVGRERVAQLLPDGGRRVARVVERKVWLVVIARYGCLGQQDEACRGGNLVEERKDVLDLVVRIAVELVVTIYIGLDDSHFRSTLLWLLVAPPKTE